LQEKAVLVFEDELLTFVDSIVAEWTDHIDIH
jgi:hypothetical protein